MPSLTWKAHSPLTAPPRSQALFAEGECGHCKKVCMGDSSQMMQATFPGLLGEDFMDLPNLCSITLSVQPITKEPDYRPWGCFPAGAAVMWLGWRSFL